MKMPEAFSHENENHTGDRFLLGKYHSASP